MNLFRKKVHELDNDSMQNGINMVTVSAPSSVVSEQFNTIRTNIKFANVDHQIKSLMITSSTASEGKSTVSANLAASFAKEGKRTLLVDTDLRRPTIKTTFNIPSIQGLTNFLTEEVFNINNVLYETDISDLYVIPSGPVPPNPSELIGSRKMGKLMDALYTKFDLIIYDAPPVLSVTDSQLLATNVDGTVLVVRAMYAQKDDVKSAVDLINHVKGNIIGTIFNDLKSSENGYYGYYGSETNK